MKYSPHNYAQALVELLHEAGENDTAKIAKKFAELIEKNGDAGKIDLVLAEVEKILAGKEGKEIYEVEFAREPGKELRDKIFTALPKGSLAKTKITPSLVAGTRITKNGTEELDYSFAGKLKKILCHTK